MGVLLSMAVFLLGLRMLRWAGLPTLTALAGAVIITLFVVPVVAETIAEALPKVPTCLGIGMALWLVGAIAFAVRHVRQNHSAIRDALLGLLQRK